MTVALAVRGLGKDYGPRTAVRALDLDVAAGECLGLLGPNGAGKTTTISMACGIVTPTRGSIAIHGVDLASEPRTAKRGLGVVPQDLAIYEPLTARQNLRYFGSLYGMARSRVDERIDWALAAVGLRERCDEPVERFSGGMKRRLNLACGLVHDPKLLVLDEPTVGVDPQSRNHIFETVKTLRGSGMTIIYTSHYMEEVELLCDRVAIMDDGAIAATGTVDELVAQHAGKGVAIEVGGEVEVAAAAVAAHGAVTRTGSRLHVIPSAGLAPCIAAIESAGATIRRIESHEANLETAFLALTGHALRDHA